MTYLEVLWGHHFQQQVWGAETRRNSEGYSRDLRGIIFNFKDVWVSLIGVIYDGKYNY